jgi:hypothetical protein
MDNNGVPQRAIDRDRREELKALTTYTRKEMRDIYAAMAGINAASSHIIIVVAEGH